MHQLPTPEFQLPIGLGLPRAAHRPVDANQVLPAASNASALSLRERRRVAPTAGRA